MANLITGAYEGYVLLYKLYRDYRKIKNRYYRIYENFGNRPVVKEVKRDLPPIQKVEKKLSELDRFVKENIRDLGFACSYHKMSSPFDTGQATVEKDGVSKSVYWHSYYNNTSYDIIRYLREAKKEVEKELGELKVGKTPTEVEYVKRTDLPHYEELNRFLAQKSKKSKEYLRRQYINEYNFTDDQLRQARGTLKSSMGIDLYH